MADSLRDQLVKAGLATASQAKKAERQAQRKQSTSGGSRRGASQNNRQTGAGGGRRADPDSPEAVRARAAKQRAEKRARDQELARVANEKAAAKALRAELRQIIVTNDQRSKTPADDDRPYNFVHGRKIKRIHLPKTQIEQLSRGALVIVNNDGIYHLVTPEVAELVRERDPKRIIAAHDKTAPEPGSDDEYYARFEVPDDLDW